MTLPHIPVHRPPTTEEWSRHRYRYVPARRKLNEVVEPVEARVVFFVQFELVALTVCRPEVDRHVTLVPTATCGALGENTKEPPPARTTSAPCAGSCASPSRTTSESATASERRSTASLLR